MQVRRSQCPIVLPPPPLFALLASRELYLRETNLCFPKCHCKPETELVSLGIAALNINVYLLMFLSAKKLESGGPQRDEAVGYVANYTD